MPRKSAASLTVVRQIHAQPIACPDDCPDGVRAEFELIVAASPPTAFVKADAALVQRLATVRLALRSPVETDEFLALVKLELALCRALRLCPSTRTDSRAAGRVAGQQPAGASKPWE